MVVPSNNFEYLPFATKLTKLGDISLNLKWLDTYGLSKKFGDIMDFEDGVH